MSYSFILKHGLHLIQASVNTAVNIFSKGCNSCTVCDADTANAHSYVANNRRQKDPYDCCSHLASDGEYFLAMAEQASKNTLRQPTKIWLFIQPFCWTTVAASAGAFNAGLWLIFALGKMKRCGIICPVALIENINVTLRPLTPDDSFPHLLFASYRRHFTVNMDIWYHVSSALNVETEQKFVFAITLANFEMNHKTWGSPRFLLLKPWILKVWKLAEDISPRTHKKNILQQLCYHYYFQDRYSYFRPSRMPISRSPSFSNASNSRPVTWIIKCSSISFQNVFSDL